MGAPSNDVLCMYGEPVPVGSSRDPFVASGAECWVRTLKPGRHGVDARIQYLRRLKRSALGALRSVAIARMTGPGPTWNVHRSSAFGFVAPGAGSWALSLWLGRQGVDVQRWPWAGQIALLLRRTNHAGRTLALDTRAGGTLVARICCWRTGTVGNGLGAHAQARSSMLHSSHGGTCAGQVGKRWDACQICGGHTPETDGASGGTLHLAEPGRGASVANSAGLDGAAVNSAPRRAIDALGMIWAQLGGADGKRRNFVDVRTAR